mmetsp:Transcript_43349/g.102817  ORF Transcript_43349/g.102817 Transcript_43349/m.102817 type:complete len:126 (-) Transcript_43349:736-1113(-)
MLGSLRSERGLAFTSLCARQNLCTIAAARSLSGLPPSPTHLRCGPEVGGRNAWQNLVRRVAVIPHRCVHRVGTRRYEDRSATSRAAWPALASSELSQATRMPATLDGEFATDHWSSLGGRQTDRQ